MRRIMILFLLLFPGLVMSQEPRGFSGNVNLYLGSKILNETDWFPFDEHDEVGLQADFGVENSLINFEIRLMSSISDEFIDVGTGFINDLETNETDLGIRLYFASQSIQTQPYLSAGLAFIEANFDNGFFIDTDDSTGIYVAGGILWQVVEHFNIGFDIMASTAEVFIDGADRDAGGIHANFVMGFHF